MVRRVRLYALGFLALPACGAASVDGDETGSASNAIIGGTLATTTDAFPGIATLVGYGTPSIPDNQFCTAVMIAPGWVATAAHCVPAGGGSSLGAMCRTAVDDPTAAPDCELDFGSPDWRDSYDPGRGAVAGETFFHIKSIHSHVGYDLPTGANDIALLELESQVPSFVASPAPILLPKWISRLAIKSPVVTAGWGAYGISGSIVNPSTVKYDSLLRVADAMGYLGDAARCNADTAYPFTYGSPAFTSQPLSMDFCAGSTVRGDHDPSSAQTNNGAPLQEVSQGPCNGDSGGPLYYDVPYAGRAVMGLTSRSAGCALESLPAIYNRLGDYADAFQRRQGNPFNLSQPIRGIRTPGFWGTLVASSFGNGTWFQGSAPINAPISADFSGDGYSDVAYYGRCGSDSHACWRVHVNTRSGGFTVADYGGDIHFQGTGYQSRPMAGDFNGDGLADIAYAGLCNSDQHLCWRVLANDGAGGFKAKDYGWNARFQNGSVTGSPVAGDFNGDGFADIAYAGLCGTTDRLCWRVHLNDQHGALVANDYGGDMAFSGSDSASAPMAADMDGNGLDDIVYFGKCPGDCWRVQRNDGKRHFQPVSWGGGMRMLGVDPTGTPVATDLNGDGYTDILYSGLCNTDNHRCIRAQLNDVGIGFKAAADDGVPTFNGTDARSTPFGGDFDGDGSSGFGYLGTCSGSTCFRMHQLP